MQSLVGFDPTHLAAAHGARAVTLFVAAGSMRLLLPSGTILMIATVHAAPLAGSVARPLRGAH